MVALPGLVRVVAASVTREGRPPALAVIAIALIAAGAALYITAGASDAQLTATLLVGRS